MEKERFPEIVSIPSNGSIQFLYINPAVFGRELSVQSQSPLTGQFNFYPMNTQELDRNTSLNPL